MVDLLERVKRLKNDLERTIEEEEKETIEATEQYEKMHETFRSFYKTEYESLAKIASLLFQSLVITKEVKLRKTQDLLNQLYANFPELKE